MSIITILAIISMIFVGKRIFKFLVYAGIILIITTFIKRVLQLSAILIVIFLIMEHFSN